MTRIRRPGEKKRRTVRPGCVDDKKKMMTRMTIHAKIEVAASYFSLRYIRLCTHWRCGG
jgi:hypothetical protein